MLDYEINHYDVVYWIGGARSCKPFSNEEDAIAFIKRTRHLWTHYKLTQQRTAIIDF